MIGYGRIPKVVKAAPSRQASTNPAVCCLLMFLDPRTLEEGSKSTQFVVRRKYMKLSVVCKSEPTSSRFFA